MTWRLCCGLGGVVLAACSSSYQFQPAPGYQPFPRYDDAEELRVKDGGLVDSTGKPVARPVELVGKFYHNRASWGASTGNIARAVGCDAHLTVDVRELHVVERVVNSYGAVVASRTLMHREDAEVACLAYSGEQDKARRDRERADPGDKDLYHRPPGGGGAWIAEVMWSPASFGSEGKGFALGREWHGRYQRLGFRFAVDNLRLAVDGASQGSHIGVGLGPVWRAFKLRSLQGNVLLPISWGHLDRGGPHSFQLRPAAVLDYAQGTGAVGLGIGTTLSLNHLTRSGVSMRDAVYPYVFLRLAKMGF